MGVVPHDRRPIIAPPVLVLNRSTQAGTSADPSACEALRDFGVGSAVLMKRISIAILVMLSCLVSAGAVGADETTGRDCGVNALYILLQLEGRPVPLDRLLSALARGHADGYSMAELAAAAEALGMRLDGVRFSKGETPPDRPAIAFVKEAGSGHFVVIRPVGTTGTMVQVINPPSVPWITDYDRLFTSPAWTGRILLLRDPWALRYALPLGVVACCLPIGFFALWHLKRSMSAEAPGATAAS